MIFMEYFVRHIADHLDRHESWALINSRCRPKLEDGVMEVYRENDIKAVASSKAELELKMASIGLEFGGIDGFCRMTPDVTLTAWTVGKAASDD